MFIIKPCLAVILSFFITKYLQEKIYILIDSNNYILINYRGKKVVNFMGISIILTFFISIIIIAFLGLEIQDSFFYAFFFSSFMGFMGFLDDILGTIDSKGFKGHIASCLKGELTTGIIKAIVGFLLAFIFSLLVSKSIIEVVLNILIISLMTNLINLFDTRPGRSIKLCIFILIFFVVTDISIFLIVLLMIILIYMPYDLKEKCVLGDTGANFLGFLLGTISVVSIEFDSLKIVISIILLFLNIISEKYSFSKIIENNKFLKGIDKIGRKKT